MGSNFRGKSEKALKINFVVLNFVITTIQGCGTAAQATCNRYTHLLSSLLLSHTYRDLDK